LEGVRVLHLLGGHEDVFEELHITYTHTMYKVVDILGRWLCAMPVMLWGVIEELTKDNIEI
jgi:hypothetical protein